MGTAGYWSIAIDKENLNKLCLEEIECVKLTKNTNVWENESFSLVGHIIKWDS